MKTLSLALLLFAASAARSVFATTVNFDDQGFVALDDVTVQYAGQGVTFQGFDDAANPVNIEVADNGVFSDNNPPSPPMSLSNFYNHDPGSRAHIMRINFLGPASGISLMYNGAGDLGSSTLFNVYNSASVLVDTLTVPAAIDSNFYLLNVPDANVGFIDIVNPGPGWGHYIDDLTFQVPEPSALALLSLGTSFLAMCRRRK